jgi:DNA-binding NarL/FixJ family response regulator
MREQGTINCVVGDDHAALRRGVTALIDREDDLAVIGEAGDGHEAVALAERRRPDVLILDMRMPGLDGIACCRELVARGVDTAVLLYTGFDDVDGLEAAIAAGARGYVVKAGPVEDFLRAVRTVGAGQRWYDASLAGRLLDRRDRETRSPLSARELEVLQLLGDGHTTEAAAQQLYLSPATVRTYTENAMHKLEARNRVHAVAAALRLQLIS